MDSSHSQGWLYINGALWWTSCLPFGPVLPTLPFTPGSPRDVRWKDGESTTCILIECLEGEEERKWSTWASFLPFGPGTPSLPLIPGTPMYRHVQWKDEESTASIIIECLEGEEERKWSTWTSFLPFGPGLPGLPSVPSSPMSPRDVQ